MIAVDIQIMSTQLIIIKKKSEIYTMVGNSNFLFNFTLTKNVMTCCKKKLTKIKQMPLMRLRPKKIAFVKCTVSCCILFDY